MRGLHSPHPHITRAILSVSSISKEVLGLILLLTEIVVEETDRLKDEQSRLIPMNWLEGCNTVESEWLAFKGFLCMIDAATLNYLTENVSHWRCSFCHLLPREFMLIKNGVFPVLDIAVETKALSILHFPLRVGDHLLKIGYSQACKIVSGKLCNSYELSGWLFCQFLQFLEKAKFTECF